MSSAMHHAEAAVSSIERERETVLHSLSVVGRC